MLECEIYSSTLTLGQELRRYKPSSTYNLIIWLVRLFTTSYAALFLHRLHMNSNDASLWVSRYPILSISTVLRPMGPEWKKYGAILLNFPHACRNGLCHGKFSQFMFILLAGFQKEGWPPPHPARNFRVFARAAEASQSEFSRARHGP